MEHRSLGTALVVLAGLAIMLAACSSPPPGPPTGSAFEGLWLVTPDEGTAYGSEGITTLAFGDGDSGDLEFISRHSGHGLTTCRTEAYIIGPQERTVSWQSVAQFGFTVVDDDQIRLENDTDGLTLTRITGAPPVEPCGRAAASQAATFHFAAAGFSGLHAVGSRLYFNAATAGDPILAYDTVAGTTGAPRTYSAFAEGGVHRFVMGARSDDLFYGHCGCGGSRSVDHFNLSLDASLQADEIMLIGGEQITVRFGHYTGTSFLAGGQSILDGQRNVVVELHQDTLALVSQRDILTGLSVSDIVVVDGQMIALSGQRMLYIGVDGRAERTFDIEGMPATAGALTAVGSDLYALVRDLAGEAVLFRLALD